MSRNLRKLIAEAKAKLAPAPTPYSPVAAGLVTRGKLRADALGSAAEDLLRKKPDATKDDLVAAVMSGGDVADTFGLDIPERLSDDQGVKLTSMIVGAADGLGYYAAYPHWKHKPDHVGVSLLLQGEQVDDDVEVAGTDETRYIRAKLLKLGALDIDIDQKIDTPPKYPRQFSGAIDSSSYVWYEVKCQIPVSMRTVIEVLGKDAVNKALDVALATARENAG